MTPKQQFDAKWGQKNPETMSDIEYNQFKLDLFDLYEKTGFTKTYKTPHDEYRHLNGMPFKVVRRTSTKEAHIDTLPQWLIEFEDGTQIHAYPEEITKIEQASAYDVCFEPMTCVRVKAADPKNPTDEEIDEIVSKARENIIFNKDEKLGLENVCFIRIYNEKDGGKGNIILGYKPKNDEHAADKRRQTVNQAINYSKYLETLQRITIKAYDRLSAKYPKKPTHEILEMLQQWATEFEDIRAKMSLEELQNTNYDYAVHTFCADKQLENPYMPAARKIKAILDDDKKLSVEVQLPNNGDMYCTITNLAGNKSAVLHWGCEGDWHRALNIPENEFDDMDRVCDALEWFDKQ